MMREVVRVGELPEVAGGGEGGNAAHRCRIEPAVKHHRGAERGEIDGLGLDLRPLIMWPFPREALSALIFSWVGRGGRRDLLRDRTAFLLDLAGAVTAPMPMSFHKSASPRADDGREGSEGTLASFTVRSAVGHHDGRRPRRRLGLIAYPGRGTWAARSCRARSGLSD